MGLATGDKVVAVDGRPVKYWEDVLRSVQEGQGRAIELTVIGVPGGERKVTVTPTRLKERDIFGDEREVWDVGMGPYIAPVIGDTVSGFPAAEAGLRPGDTVVEIEGRPVLSWSDLAEAINRRPGQPTERGAVSRPTAGQRPREGHHRHQEQQRPADERRAARRGPHAAPRRPGQPTRLVVQRGTERVALTVTPRAVKDRGPDGKEAEVGRIGISPAPGTTYVRENPILALRDGVQKTVEVTALTATGLWKIVVGQLDRSNIGGPIQIAQAAGEQARQGLPSLAFFTAVISVNLALLNLLPVPMLDGGHLLFFVCEAILGRPLSLRKREVAQQVGFVLLMMLMVYAVYNDLVRIDVLRFFR